MSGSISLAGMAALRCGAGLVRLAVPNGCLETVASYSPCFMTLPLADDEHGQLRLAASEELGPWLEKSTCVALGPGLGTSRGLQGVLRQVLRESNCPLVIDADGLNNLAGSRNWWKSLRAPVVLTPHPGEWSRLSGVASSDRVGQCQAAIAMAGEAEHLVIVLKGHRTLITDGETAVWNSTGTPAMATGGSGDVLTGVITALICQGLSPRDAAHLGVHAHGLAAQLAERKLGAHVVLPTELITYLSPALAQLNAS